MRVVLVIGSAEVGGAERQLVRLACELSGRGVDVRVLFAVAGGPLTRELDDHGVRWRVLRPGRVPTTKGRDLAAAVHLALRLVRWQPDVVFAWMAGVVWVTLPLAAVLTRARRIAAFRGIVFDDELRWTARPFRYAVRHAHAVTANAPWLEGEAVRCGARPERVVFIPNGVDLPTTQAAVTQSPPTAVVVANFRWYKGHDLLVDALAHVDQPLRVRLVGEGEQREPTALRAVERGVAARLDFVDHPADVPAELQAAQFAIHPSRTEGLSNAILEALAAGLPVIANDVGGCGLLVDDGVNGYLVPAGDEHLLAQRIGGLAASPQLRSEMAVAARAKAAEFGWDRCTDRYLRLFDDLTAARR